MRTPMLSAALAAALCLLPAAGGAAAAFPTPPFRDQLLSGKTVRVSRHVWVINGFPNIAIVVGKSATLVVDTGLGRRNGATVARAARRLAPRNRLYLTTTHFHPEHVAGVTGFPPGTILIRNQAQQDELDRHGKDMLRLFAGVSPQWHALLDGEPLRAPEFTFEREMRINLDGGVTARLFRPGAAHTVGDQLVLVEPDRTLISGDVVQNQVGPYIYGEGGSAASWVAIVEGLAGLDVLHVVPDHSPVGDGGLIRQQLAVLTEMRERALALKDSGVDAGQAGARLTREFQQKYPDWTINDLSGFVQGAWDETKVAATPGTGKEAR
ncbi:MBL fold metallo-hydrolase [Janthinobacterium sp. HH01]|uniref:MBL fold metallo-hydrolase n=1 Tax=Janthinobacterium sp. HH01 TaxID=1198452 RepID=UPI00034A095D|nr:MBL fold metallo-hydrolase [Janthinobacterium sp. HH01]